MKPETAVTLVQEEGAATPLPSQVREFIKASKAVPGGEKGQLLRTQPPARRTS
jgi:hypothetical protein